MIFLLGKRKAVFSNRVLLGISTPREAPYPGVISQHKQTLFSFFVCGFCFVFVYFVLLIFNVVLISYFCFVFERERIWGLVSGGGTI